MSKVLWAYRITARTVTGETLFSLGYRMEAVFPVELGLPTCRVAYFDDERNEELMRLELDLLEEKRVDSQLRLVAYQRIATKYYNKKVKQRGFCDGELIFRKVMSITKPKNSGALGPN